MGIVAYSGGYYSDPASSGGGGGISQEDYDALVAEVQQKLLTQTFQTFISDLNGGVVPEELNSLNEISTRIISGDAINAAQGSDINVLDTRVDNIDVLNTSQTSEINGLDSRLDTVESANTTQTADIASLDSRLDAEETASATLVSRANSNDVLDAAQQAQINNQAVAITGKQPLSQELIDIAALTGSATDLMQRQLVNGVLKWVVVTLATLKQQMGVDGVLCKAYELDENITIPGYISGPFNELFFLQNNLVQHTARLIQWHGFGTTTYADLGFGTPRYTGTQTGINAFLANEWTQVGKISLSTSVSCGLSFARTTHFHSYDSVNFGYAFSILFSAYDNGGAGLVANSRMFVGNSTSTAAVSGVSSVDPLTLTNVIGLIQSPTAPNPNNLYFMINGTNATPWTFDTGLVLQNDYGYRFSTFYIKSTNQLELRVTTIIGDITVHTLVDLDDLLPAQKPASTAYSPRIWRANTALGNNRLAIAKIYLENKN